MMRSDLETQVRDDLAETSTSFFSDAQVDRKLNEALSDLARIVPFSVESFSLSTLADQQEYELPTRLLTIQRCRYSTTLLEATSIRELDELDSSWQSASSGTPTKYYTSGHRLGLYVAPSSAAVAVTVLAQSSPPDMLSATDEPRSLPAAFHSLVGKLAAVKLCQLDIANAESQARLATLLPQVNVMIGELSAFVRDRVRDMKHRLMADSYRVYWRRR